MANIAQSVQKAVRDATTATPNQVKEQIDALSKKATTPSLPLMTITTDAPIPEDKSWITGTAKIFDGQNTVFDGKL